MLEVRRDLREHGYGAYASLLIARIQFLLYDWIRRRREGSACLASVLHGPWEAATLPPHGPYALFGVLGSCLRERTDMLGGSLRHPLGPTAVTMLPSRRLSGSWSSSASSPE